MIEGNGRVAVVHVVIAFAPKPLSQSFGGRSLNRQLAPTGGGLGGRMIATATSAHKLLVPSIQFAPRELDGRGIAWLWTYCGNGCHHCEEQTRYQTKTAAYRIPVCSCFLAHTGSSSFFKRAREQARKNTTTTNNCNNVGLGRRLSHQERFAFTRKCIGSEGDDIHVGVNQNNLRLVEEKARADIACSSHKNPKEHARAEHVPLRKTDAPSTPARPATVGTMYPVPVPSKLQYCK